MKTKSQKPKIKGTYQIFKNFFVFMFVFLVFGI